jgi:hypothetical protein
LLERLKIQRKRWFVENEKRTDETFLPLHSTAARLGVPIAWLRAEADANRVPVLRAGRRLLFNPEVVKAVLLARAGQSTEGTVASAR